MYTVVYYPLPSSASALLDEPSKLRINAKRDACTNKSHPNPCIASDQLPLGKPLTQHGKQECQRIGNRHCQ